MSNSITDIIRKRMYLRAGIEEKVNDQSVIKKDIYEKQSVLYSLADLAANRLAMGTFRYGVSDHSRYNYRIKLSGKLTDYDNTGNKEFLIDAMNYCVLEFNWSQRSDTFYNPVDRNESWEFPNG